MAKMSFKKGGGGRSFTPHPTGSFLGYVCEVQVGDPKTYPRNDGGQSHADVRFIVIRNCDGNANYEYQDQDGATQTAPCTVRTKPLNFYHDGEGNYFEPTSKSAIHQYYTAILGQTPDFSDFDDECVLGTKVVYTVQHVDAKDPDDPSKVYANLTGCPTRNPDQTLPQGYEVVTQSEKQEQQSEQAKEDSDAEFTEGSAGKAEHYKSACRTWISYLHEYKAYDDVIADRYLKWLNASPEFKDLERFIEKAEADCKKAGLAFPSPNPLSTAGDDIPF